MKKEDIIVMGMAGLAVFLLYGFLNKKAAPVYANDYSTKLVTEWAGWKYYSDGTVIGPDGSYYLKGEKLT